MKRYLTDQVLADLKRKMVIITGPRQVGKTFLAKQVMSAFNKPQYLNYDNLHDKDIITKQSWRLNSDFLVFDEIHKMKNWKVYLKGVFDSRMPGQSILVTGSARLETFRQSGESLAGRYLHLRLNPISVKELGGKYEPYDAIEQLMRIGGFPEPFLEEKTTRDEFSARWRNQYYTDLIREDVLDYSRIHEIKTMSHLLELLRGRVGSKISYKSLAEDLQSSPNTIKKYIQILESLFIIFLVHPYYKNIARAILKEPKIYFFDSGYVKGDDGAKFENLCAVSLLKHVQFQHDAKGKIISLNYIRTRDGKEIDFVLVDEERTPCLIEAKLSSDSVSKNLLSFSTKIDNCQSIQLVHNLRQERFIKGVEILHAGKWLASLDA